MSNWYVSYPLWQAVAAWAASTNYNAGDIRRQSATPTAGNERVFLCTTAGKSGSSEPGWSLNRGNTTSDGSVVWTEITGNEAYQAPGAWAAPHASVYASTNNWAVNGDTIFVDKNHSRTLPMSFQWSGGNATLPKRVFSVDASSASHVPPLATDVVKGASEGTSGTFSLTIQDWWSEINGLTLTAGSGAGSASLNISSGGGAYQRYRNSTLALGATSGGTMTFGPNNGSKVLLDNTQISFASSAQVLQMNTEITWRDTPVLLVSGSALPVTLIRYNGNTSSNLTFENVDFSTYTAGTLIGNAQGGVSARLLDCKIPPNVTIVAAPSGNVIATVTLVNCDSGGLIGRHEQYMSAGSQFTETTVVRTGGATYGTTPISWRIVTNTYADNYVSMANAQWVTATGAQTVTVEGIWNAATLPTQDDLYVDVRFPGTAGSTLGSRGTGGKTNGLATAAAMPASTAAWDSLAPARSNSANYTAGAVIKLASNPGRIFFCTAPGASAGSEPAAYASAVDGGAVTDGGATFRAGVRFKLQASINVAIPGYVNTQIRVLRNSATFYIDPMLVIG